MNKHVVPLVISVIGLTISLHNINESNNKYDLLDSTIVITESQDCTIRHADNVRAVTGKQMVEKHYSKYRVTKPITGSSEITSLEYVKTLTECQAK